MSSANENDPNRATTAGAGAKAVEEILKAWRAQEQANMAPSDLMWTRRATTLLEAVHSALWHVSPGYTRDELVSSLKAAWIEESYIKAHAQTQLNGGPWPPHLLKLRGYVEQGMPGFKVDVLIKDGTLKQIGAVYGHHYYLTGVIAEKLNSKS